MSVLTVATVARQRGRAPQLPFIMSSTRSAVVLGSTVTGLSSGTGGSFTLAHSPMMSGAVMNFSPVVHPVVPRLRNTMQAPPVARMRPQSFSASARVSAPMRI